MNTRLEYIEPGVAQVTFDREGSSANVFDRATLQELDAHLDALEADSSLTGVVFSSAKKSIFIAGADITELLSKDLSPADLRAMVAAGQDVFSRVAGLGVVTVAAIHGACLGGGYELCLACDYRIASDDRATRIGLPETSLGIVPAWGGCARLPRLIGLPKALDAVLNGRRFAAGQALRKGMVDEVVPREHLVRRALALVATGKRAGKGFPLVNNAVAARIIRARVGPALAAKTRGNYPAVPRALEVMTAGISRPVPGALALEEQAVADLAGTAVCRNLVGVFFLQDRAKRTKAADLAILGDRRAEAAESTGRADGSLAVVGAGVMGAGIAQWASSRGRRVLLRDINEEQVRKGMATIGGLYKEGAKRHLFTRTEAQQGLDRVLPCADEVSMRHVDLVIEAAVETMSVKKQIFEGLKRLTREDTILATNTSALSVSELGVAAGCPERVIGIHFFNPVHRMPLVEVVVGEGTSGDVVARTLRFVQAIGKLPVVVRDRPGFVVNRVLVPYLIEAGHLFEQGAGVEAIDRAMLDFGMPMGPLRLIDEIGVDVARHVAAFFAETFGERMALPAVLQAMTDAGQLGRKSGEGFYVHDKGKKEPRPSVSVNKQVLSQDAAAMTDEDLRERMTLVMLNEAARCVEEEVTSAPEDIDFAMIMGTGFAPFRGGPLRYLDSLGAKTVVAGLTRLAEDEHPRFAPCEILLEQAKGEARFYGD
jgi:3-hydroxyacyl-CoA dehydrogenase/enoyl-CoA hydratase/3-hydroxybutyryl-CoA epimerase